ncbi:hypothetical protein N806_30325 [Rhodococcus sp. P27]|nr:hypothetical protein N806_30325 [Rhodococcus sp. P27]
MRQVVAGVDHEVGVEAFELTQPILFQPLVRHHVQVAEMEDPQRRRTGRQDWHRHLTQCKCIAFDAGCVPDP